MKLIAERLLPSHANDDLGKTAMTGCSGVMKSKCIHHMTICIDMSSVFASIWVGFGVNAGTCSINAWMEHLVFFSESCNSLTFKAICTVSTEADGGICRPREELFSDVSPVGLQYSLGVYDPTRCKQSNQSTACRFLFHFPYI